MMPLSRRGKIVEKIAKEIIKKAESEKISPLSEKDIREINKLDTYKISLLREAIPKIEAMFNKLDNITDNKIDFYEKNNFPFVYGKYYRDGVLMGVKYKILYYPKVDETTLSDEVKAEYAKIKTEDQLISDTYKKAENEIAKPIFDEISDKLIDFFTTRGFEVSDMKAPPTYIRIVHNGDMNFFFTYTTIDGTDALRHLKPTTLFVKHYAKQLKDLYKKLGI